MDPFVSSHYERVARQLFQNQTIDNRKLLKHLFNNMMVVAECFKAGNNELEQDICNHFLVSSAKPYLPPFDFGEEV